MSSPSKNKGSSFEREVAKFLSELYQESFIRSPGSGAHIGGKNNSRTEFLHEGQIRSFKGDIVPGQSFPLLNVECKNYAQFPFHQLFTEECKQLDGWLKQLLDVAEPNDLSVLFIKITRTGKFVCVPANLTWMTNQFMYYSSKKYNDWIIVDFDLFFKYNKDMFKGYSSPVNSSGSTQAHLGSTDTTS